LLEVEAGRYWIISYARRMDETADVGGDRLNVEEMIRNINRRELGGLPSVSEDTRVCIARTIADLVPFLFFPPTTYSANSLVSQHNPLARVK
jgi:hypothetical protein